GQGQPIPALRSLHDQAMARPEGGARPGCQRGARLPGQAPRLGPAQKGNHEAAADYGLTVRLEEGDRGGLVSGALAVLRACANGIPKRLAALGHCTAGKRLTSAFSFLKDRL